VRSRIGARGEVQVVSSGRITLGVEVEDVSVERRAVTEIEVGVRVSDVIEDHRSVGAGPRNTQRMHDDRGRRHVVAVAVAELIFDRIRGAALLRHAGVVKRTNLVVNARGSKCSCVNAVIALERTPDDSNVAVGKNAYVAQTVINRGCRGMVESASSIS
jgi:hypothetical protein